MVSECNKSQPPADRKKKAKETLFFHSFCFSLYIFLLKLCVYMFPLEKSTRQHLFIYAGMQVQRSCAHIQTHSRNPQPYLPNRVRHPVHKFVIQDLPDKNLALLIGDQLEIGYTMAFVQFFIFCFWTRKVKQKEKKKKKKVPITGNS